MKKQYNAPKLECNEIATANILSASGSGSGSGSIDSNSVNFTDGGSTKNQGITSAQAKNTIPMFMD